MESLIFSKKREVKRNDLDIIYFPKRKYFLNRQLGVTPTISQSVRHYCPIWTSDFFKFCWACYSQKWKMIVQQKLLKTKKQRKCFFMWGWRAYNSLIINLSGPQWKQRQHFGGLGYSRLATINIHINQSMNQSTS